MTDLCCTICKSAHGICLTRGSCDHHKRARAMEDADDRARQTYADPTARLAIQRADRRPRTRGRRR